MLFFKKRKPPPPERLKNNQGGQKTLAVTSAAAPPPPPPPPPPRAFTWKELFRFQPQKSQQAFYDRVEEVLLAGDVGGHATLELIAELKEHVAAMHVADPSRPIDPALQRHALRELLSGKLREGRLDFPVDRTPVIVILGVNGTGKTTTLAKLAAMLQKQYQVVIGAGDTFRAAAVEQLEHWSKLLALPLIKKDGDADSAAIAYDTIESACAKPNGLALIDTAGRLHNQSNLMSELEKIFRVIGKFAEKTKVLKLLVADVTQGQNVIAQIKTFHDKVQLDGIILSKCDTASRGGMILSLAKTLSLPVYFITFGENLTDFAPFETATYLSAFFPDTAA